MTLGSWFRDYVYIPMGGNRVKKVRWVFNLAVVWALTGFWHGAAWNFVFWGLIFAVMLPLEKQFYMDFLNKHKVLSHIYALFFILLSFVVFNADSMAQVGSDLAGLFSGISFVLKGIVYGMRNNVWVLSAVILAAIPLAFSRVGVCVLILLGLAIFNTDPTTQASLFSSVPLVSGETLYCLKSNAWMLCIAIFAATPVAKNAMAKLEAKFGEKLWVAQSVLCLLALILCTAYLVDGSFNPFLYFRF